jgi:hypothetical protein
MDDDVAQESHRDRARAIQRVIVRLVEERQGDSVSATIDRLTMALAAAGIPRQPVGWLEAVAHDAVSGRIYIVSQDAFDETGVALDALGALQSGELNGAPDGDRVRRGDQAN